MDEENNLENPEEDIEFLEDDFVEVVDLDGEGETAEGTIKTLVPFMGTMYLWHLEVWLKAIRSYTFLSYC